MILIHPREELADPELLPSVKEQAKQVLLEKGVELLLGNNNNNSLCSCYMLRSLSTVHLELMKRRHFHITIIVENFTAVYSVIYPCILLHLHSFTK